MTNLDIMVTILCEVTGKPEPEIRKVITMATLNVPAHIRNMPIHGLNAEVPEAQAKEKLAQLRKEKSGVLNWLVQGAREAHENPSTVNGVHDAWNRRN